MISGLNSDGLPDARLGARSPAQRRRATMRLAAAGAAVVAIGGVVAVPVSASASSHPAVRFAKVMAAPRLPSQARNLGAVSSSTVISGSVALSPRDPAALQRAATAVSNPKSAAYRHYLGKGQFAARFGPSPATVAAVKDALDAASLKVGTVSSNGLLVHFSGSAGSVESAFHTKLATFALPGGRTGRETTTSVSFPASVASQVTGVIGLNTLARASSSFEHNSSPSTKRPVGPLVSQLTHSPGAPNACAGAGAAATTFGGLTDDQIAHAYGVDGLYSAGDVGAAQHIAVFELEPYSTADLTAFDKCYFPSTATAMLARVTNKTIDGGSGTGEGSGESILDLDDVSGLAPGANIDVYEAPNTASGALDEYNAMVTDDVDSIITTSWGFCEADVEALSPGALNLENAVFQQAALQGQSVFSSSGDAGSDGCAYHGASPVAPVLSQGDPGTQPFVTSVGGTTITDASNPPSENVWNDGSPFGGAGGGLSSVWAAPSWQQSSFTAADTTQAADAVTTGDQTPCAQSSDGSLCREVPDVSAQADEFTGAITVYAKEFGGWTTSGGTSSSTPLWAAMVADINASAGCAPAHNVGFISPALYAVAATPAGYAASFNDVTSGNNDLYDVFNGDLFSAGPGFDMASGLGTPRIVGPNGHAGLASALCALGGTSATPPPAIASLSPAASLVAGGGTLTITGSNLGGVDAASIGGYSVPAADISASASSVTITPIPTAKQATTAGLGPQDGAGRAIVSLTDTTSGLSSAPVAASSLLYVDGAATATSVPAVSGVSAYGGADAGGNVVTIYGSGFDASDTVKIGGVAATEVTPVPTGSTTALTVKVPAYTSGTTTCATAADPATDVCQAQVIVSNSNGDSAPAQILPAHQGAYLNSTGLEGGAVPDCVTNSTCEIGPAASEYDYFATPTISSITTTAVGASPVWASENGSTIATIDGTGFNYLGFDWVAIGSKTVAADQDYDVVSISPTELQIVITGRGTTTEPQVTSLYVQTLAGASAGSPISYAGVPTVSALSVPAVPATGKGSLTITGKGFQGIDLADGGEIEYEYVLYPFETDQRSGYTATSDTSIAVSSTPQNNPGAYVVSVCTMTGCSQPTSEKSFEGSLIDFFAPGDPVVTGVSVKKGPASGGTKVIITGRNLSDAVIVKFGKVVAESANAPQLLTNGSSTEVQAFAPPGAAGSTVNITVTTVESLYGGGHPSPVTAAAAFTYVASPPSAPLDVHAVVQGKNIKVTWKAPAVTGGHPVTKYKVSARSLPNSFKKGAKKAPTVTATTSSGSARSAVVKGLRAGWTYVVTVRAVNSKGLGLGAEAPRVYTITDPA